MRDEWALPRYGLADMSEPHCHYVDVDIEWDSRVSVDGDIVDDGEVSRWVSDFDGSHPVTFHRCGKVYAEIWPIEKLWEPHIEIHHIGPQGYDDLGTVLDRDVTVPPDSILWFESRPLVTGGTLRWGIDPR